MGTETQSKRMSKARPAEGVREAFRERIEDLSQQAAEVAANLERLALFRLPATLFGMENGVDFYDEVRRFEISLIVGALKHTKGSQTRAARLLKMSHTTLNTKLKTYNIAWREYSKPSLSNQRIS